jgi:hypothetical protein
MLDCLWGRATDRKLRLFAVACCRFLSGSLVEPRGLRAVEVVERFADGTTTPDALRVACSAAQDAFRYLVGGTKINYSGAVHAAAAAADVDADVAARDASSRTLFASRALVAWVKGPGDAEPQAMECQPILQELQVGVLRDLFGPLPFRPVTLDPSVLAWHDGTVVRLARSIYDERRFVDLPLLGDALLDAGCDQEEVVAHCRAGGEHVKGCWVLDLCLGKE